MVLWPSFCEKRCSSQPAKRAGDEFVPYDEPRKHLNVDMSLKFSWNGACQPFWLGTNLAIYIDRRIRNRMMHMAHGSGPKGRGKKGAHKGDSKNSTLLQQDTNPDDQMDIAEQVRMVLPETAILRDHFTPARVMVFPGNASIHLVRLRHAYMACWYLKCWLLIGLRKIEDTWINSDWLRPEAHWPWRQLWSSFWRKEFAHETCHQISWNLQNASMCCCQWHGRHQQVGKIQSCWHTPSGWNTWTLVVFDVTPRIWQDVQILYISEGHAVFLAGVAGEHSEAHYVQDSVKR